MNPTIVNLVSGGLDSFLVWRMHAHTQNTVNLYVKLGHAYQEKELDALNVLKFKDPFFRYEVVDGPPIGDRELKPSGIIPLRNAELILAAAQIGTIIFLGVLEDEINSDKSPEFFSAMQTVLNISWRRQYWTEGQQFLVTSPIRTLTKAELIAQYLQAGFPEDLLRATVSCYSKEEGHCGNCSACFKRWVAFRLNKLDIAEEFNRYPRWWGVENDVVGKARSKVYSEKRAAEVLEAMERK